MLGLRSRRLTTSGSSSSSSVVVTIWRGCQRQTAHSMWCPHNQRRAHLPQHSPSSGITQSRSPFPVSTAPGMTNQAVRQPGCSSRISMADTLNRGSVTSSGGTSWWKHVIIRWSWVGMLHFLDNIAGTRVGEHVNWYSGTPVDTCFHD